MATDNFDRADLGSNWTKISTDDCSIESNKVRTGVNVESAIRWSAEGVPDNQYSSVVMLTSDMSSYTMFGPVVRAQVSGFSGYAFRREGDFIYRMYKIVSGSWTQLGSVFYNPSEVSGDVLRLEIVGSTLKAFINGVLKRTASDSTYASGSPGIYIYQVGTSPVFYGDDWEGGAIKSRTMLPSFKPRIAE